MDRHRVRCALVIVDSDCSSRFSIVGGGLPACLLPIPWSRECGSGHHTCSSASLLYTLLGELMASGIQRIAVVVLASCGLRETGGSVQLDKLSEDKPSQLQHAAIHPADAGGVGSHHHRNDYNQVMPLLNACHME